jgi:hypothetical protein
MTGLLDYALLDRSGAGATVFYPRPDPVAPPEGAADLAIEVAPGVAVGARFYGFDRALPTILYFHGNGEVASDHDDIAPFYHQAGANLFVVEFRGYGRSGGRPTFASLVGDALPVVEAFHAQLDTGGFAGSRFVMGRSLGTQPALEAAARGAGRLRGLIVESGAGNLRRMAGRLGLDPAAPDVTALVDGHEAKVRSIRLPALVIHGEDDDLVPIQAAFDLLELLGEGERQLVVIPGAGHNDLLWRGVQEYFTAVADFVARHAVATG